MTEKAVYFYSLSMTGKLVNKKWDDTVYVPSVFLYGGLSVVKTHTKHTHKKRKFPKNHQLSAYIIMNIISLSILKLVTPFDYHKFN